MRKTIANESGGSTSLWMRRPVDERHGSFPDVSEVDVCVVGAGIAGISTAYELVLRGKRVIVLDDGPVGRGETARSTAHLSSALDDGFVRLEALHGPRGAGIAARSHRAAIDRIEGIAAAERIDCRFHRRDGYLFADGKDDTRLDKELAAAQRAGLYDSELVKETPLLDYDAGSAIRFPRQATFDPLAYVCALAARVERHGGRIYTGVHVDRIDESAEVRVVTSSGEIVLATHIVIATNAPIHGAAEFPTRQAAHRSYVIGMVVPRAKVTPALFWDMSDPYHYVRLADEPRVDGADVLLVGGEDHRTDQDQLSELRYRELESWARKRFPMAGDVVESWSGQVMEPIDGVAFIGPSPGSSNVLVITGDSGHGITHGVIGSILCTEQVFGRSHEWAPLYDPGRRSLRAMREYLRDGIESVRKYGASLRAGRRGASATNELDRARRS